MLGYSDKDYQISLHTGKSPLIQSIQEEGNDDISFFMISSQVAKSIQMSRVLPLTLNQQKCKNCQKLQSCISTLVNQLLAIEKNILEKEVMLNRILSQKIQTIKNLEIRIENLNEKSSYHHLGSTFHSVAQAKFHFNQTQTNNFIQDKTSNSQISQKKQNKHSYFFAYNFDVPPLKNHQKMYKKNLLSQNISPNNIQLPTDRLIKKLQFQNHTIKNYNETLLAQLQKLNKIKSTKLCSFYGY